MRISNEVLQELVDSYDDSSMEHSYYFNIKTNEIVFFSDYLDSGEEYEKLNEEVEEGFGETVKSEEVQDKLYRALSGHRGVFRRFKDTLMDYPEIQQQYYQYKEGEIKSE